MNNKNKHLSAGKAGKVYKIKTRKKTNRNMAESKSFVISLGCLLAVFSLAYLFQITGVTVLSFEKQKMERKLYDLTKDHQKMKTQIAGLNEINNINGKGMVQINNIEYLSVADNNVAMAR